MTQIPWQLLDDALNRAAAAGHRINLWWRDDDAVAATPALDKLLTLKNKLDLPLLLAVIPAHVDAGLFSRLKDEDKVWVAVHGYGHVNHAPAAEKKQELGSHRPVEVIRDELAAGQARLAAMAGGKLLPVLVPPWNRITPANLAGLPEIGLTCLSTFGPVPGKQAGLTWLNTHLDPIDWRGARSLADPARLIAQFIKLINDRETPIGFLSHHLVHDDAIWGFTDEFLTRMAGHPWVDWPPIPALIEKF